MTLLSTCPVSSGEGAAAWELGTASLLPLWEPYLEPEPRASAMPGPSPAPPTHPMLLCLP